MVTDVTCDIMAELLGQAVSVSGNLKGVMTHVASKDDVSSHRQVLLRGAYVKVCRSYCKVA